MPFKSDDISLFNTGNNKNSNQGAGKDADKHYQSYRESRHSKGGSGQFEGGQTKNRNGKKENDKVMSKAMDKDTKIEGKKTEDKKIEGKKTSDKKKTEDKKIEDKTEDTKIEDKAEEMVMYKHLKMEKYEKKKGLEPALDEAAPPAAAKARFHRPMASNLNTVSAVGDYAEKASMRDDLGAFGCDKDGDQLVGKTPYPVARVHTEEGVANDNDCVDGFARDLGVDKDDGIAAPEVTTMADMIITLEARLQKMEQSIQEVKKKTEDLDVDEDEKFPRDSYSFLVPIDDKNDNGYYKTNRWLFRFFGFFVFLVQITFLILLIWSVTLPKTGTTETSDNPDDNIFANFIPANSKWILKIAQILSLSTYVLLPESTLIDIVTAVLFLPFSHGEKMKDQVLWVRGKNNHDQECWMRYASAFKVFQGVLAVFATMFLVLVSGTKVIDVILNFSALAFVSDLDERAFNLAEAGAFGPHLKKQAGTIKKADLPDSATFTEERQTSVYHRVMFFVALGFCVTLIVIISLQESSKTFVTEDFRLNIDSRNEKFEQYNGCFEIDPFKPMANRFTYQYSDRGTGNPTPNATIGYCLEERRWVLYNGQGDESCPPNSNTLDEQNLTEDEWKERNWILYSSRTDDFDIAISFEDPWFTSSGKIVDIDYLEAENCQAFGHNGICNSELNNEADEWDDGDCCASTCTESNCGALTDGNTIFGTPNVSGVHFGGCKDTKMKKITIRLNDMRSSRSETYFPEEPTLHTLSVPKWRNQTPDDTYFALYCDGKNVLTAYINGAMVEKSQTVHVEDNAICHVRTRKAGDRLFAPPIWYVNYTIEHDENITILTENSYNASVKNFTRIPDCFFEKLEAYVDKSSMYSQSKQAIHWLLDDKTGNSNCEDELFVERYALAKMSFDMKNSFISTDGVCSWQSVTCSEGVVTQLELTKAENSMIGIPSEISLLADLETLILDSFTIEQSLYDVVQLIKNLKKLSSLLLGNNSFSGTLPSELGDLKSLKKLYFYHTDFTGEIPSEIGKLTNLVSLFLSDNALNGTVPIEIGNLTSLKSLTLYNNDLTGTIPTEFGKLTNLIHCSIARNSFTGTIPTEFGELSNIEQLFLYNNSLSGLLPNMPTSLEVLDGKDYNELIGKPMYYNKSTGNLTILQF